MRKTFAFLLTWLVLAGMLGALSTEAPDPVIKEVESRSAAECFASGEEVEYEVTVENFGESSGNVVVVPECTAPFVGFPSDPEFLELDDRHIFYVSVRANSETQVVGTCTMVARAIASSSNRDEWPITVCVKGSGAADSGLESEEDTVVEPPAQTPAASGNATGKPGASQKAAGCLGAVMLLSCLLLVGIRNGGVVL
jgi:hypothetical protein